MVGDRSAPIDELEARACTTENLFPAVPMCWLGGAAEGVDWQVLKEQQYVPLSFRNPILL
jgi:hypothetical protein